VRQSPVGLAAARTIRRRRSRAATPDLPVDELAAEGWSLPVLIGGRHDVDVALQQERRAVAGALQPGDEVRPGRVLRVGLGLATGLFEQAPDEPDARRLVPRRVRRVESDQLLEELGGCQ
jgi:hypothetical protein